MELWVTDISSVEGLEVYGIKHTLELKLLRKKNQLIRIMINEWVIITFFANNFFYYYQ
jgi:hypothetical protein